MIRKLSEEEVWDSTRTSLGLARDRFFFLLRLRLQFHGKCQEVESREEDCDEETCIQGEAEELKWKEYGMMQMKQGGIGMWEDGLIMF